MSDHDDILKSLFTTSTDTVFVDVLRREVWIDGDIEDHAARDVIRAVNYFKALNTSSIDVCINTNGGSLSEGLAIADYFRLMSSQGFVISTRVLGVAYSAGALIASSGTPGHRYALPSSRYLIHQLSASGVDGKMEELQSDIKNLRAMNEQMARMIAAVTDKTLAAVQKDLKKESFMSVDEAIKYGLVDHVIT